MSSICSYFEWNMNACACELRQKEKEKIYEEGFKLSMYCLCVKPQENGRKKHMLFLLHFDLYLKFITSILYFLHSC